ncbi:acetyl-CoA C-acyltransferase [Rhodococcus qingshengii]|nr:acetyl-CoA C-acyltransferase [Rhodococcus qingshengii]
MMMKKFPIFIKIRSFKVKKPLRKLNKLVGGVKVENVVLVDGVRTPFGKLGGNLKDFSSVALGSMVIKETMRRTKMEADSVDEVIMGSAMLAGATSVAARQMLFKSGLLETTKSMTIDRACCSSMTAVGVAMKNILAGDSDVVLAGGIESMSQTPLLLREARWGSRLGDITAEDPLKIKNPITNTPVAYVTGHEALKYGVDREQQDEWALGSHLKYFAAFESNKFKDELMSVEIPQRKSEPIIMNKDESPRPDTSYYKLRNLKTVYDSPTITAGNAPGLNDGATLLTVMSQKKQQELNLHSIGTILSYVNVSGDPNASVIYPGIAIQKALQKANISLKDLKRIEINEAFAAMPLVSTKVLSDGDNGLLTKLRSITNVNGGAVAMGHPTGASGARLIMTLAYELRRLGGGYGAAAICGGYGQADAVIIRVD